MNHADLAAVLAILCLTLFNAFFTLAETALVTVRSLRLSQIATEEGETPPGMEQVQDLMRQPTHVVATVQVGITLTSFAVAALAAAVLGEHLWPVLQRWGVPYPRPIAIIVLTLVAALFTIAVGEIVPRSIALRRPEKVALSLASALRFFMVLFAPLAGTALGLSHLLVRPFGLTATFAAPVMTEEELRTLLDAGAHSGAIEEEEKEFIRRVISFGDTEVRQVMTPRMKIKAGEVGLDLPALLALIVDSGHSRIPIYEGTVDAIAGIVHAKDLLPLLARGEPRFDLGAVMRAPLLVPENRLVDELLAEFRRSGTQMAIVQDEYGGTAGLATIEDLLEELVGEIKDEYDLDEDEDQTAPIRTLDDATSLVDGRLAINDLNEALDLHLSDDDYETVGGYVFGLFGHQPTENESVLQDGLQFTITRTDGRRIQEIRLQRVFKTGSEPEDAFPAKPV